MTELHGPPFAIGGLDHVVLRVSDMDRAVQFYTEVVGAREERRIEEIGMVQMRAGTSLIDLVPTGEDHERPGAFDHFAITVAPFDVAAITEHLDRHGVDHGDVARRYGAQGFGPSIYFADPDGNQIELTGPAEA